MAVGFTPKYETEISTEGLSNADYIVIALDAIRKCGWEVTYISAAGLMAITDTGVISKAEEITIKVLDGVVDIKSEVKDSRMIDWGKNKKNVEKFIATMQTIKGNYTSDTLKDAYHTLSEQFPPASEDVLLQPPATTAEQAKSVMAIFIPTTNYFITPFLMLANIGIWIAMVVTGTNVMDPTTASLVKWGANFAPMTLEGQPWRLLTCCFIHIGIIHLLLNMYALVYVGSLLEPLIGKTQFIVAYLLTGICASLASLWWHNPPVVSAGASGAIFGLYGIFIALLTTNLVEKEARTALLTSAGIFVFYNLIYGLKGGVDNAAHTGGLVSGIIIGYALLPGTKNASLKYIGLAVLCVLVIGGAFFALKKIPNSVGNYDKLITQYSVNEEKAIQMFNEEYMPNPEGFTDAKRDTFLNLWKESSDLAKSASELEVDKEYKLRNQRISSYYLLRYRQFALLLALNKSNLPQGGNDTTQLNSIVREADSLVQVLNAK